MLFGAACAMKPVHVAQLSPAVPSPLVARKAMLPAVVVVESIPDTYTTHKGQTKPIDIFELRTFARRDLRQLATSWFTTVHEEGGEPVDGPHVQIRVSISKIGTSTTSSVSSAVAGDGIGTFATSSSGGYMDWSVAVQIAGEDGFVFSMTDRAPGANSISSIFGSEELVLGILESALVRFAQAYEQSGAHERILAHEAALAAPAELSETAEAAEAAEAAEP